MARALPALRAPLTELPVQCLGHLKAITLTMENAREIIEEIINIDVQDGVSFSITKETDIMEGHDYPGIRFMLEAVLDRMRQVIKIDISTGDVITPQAVEYSYNHYGQRKR